MSVIERGEIAKAGFEELGLWQYLSIPQRKRFIGSSAQDKEPSGPRRKRRSAVAALQECKAGSKQASVGSRVEYHGGWSGPVGPGGGKRRKVVSRLRSHGARGRRVKKVESNVMARMLKVVSSLKSGDEACFPGKVLATQRDVTLPVATIGER